MSDHNTQIEIEAGKTLSDVRQNLVNTATEFLNMDKIISQPEIIKRQFLEKKGLTKEEIEIAFQRSQLKKPIVHHAGIQEYNPNLQNQLIYPSPNAIVVRRPTFWMKLRDNLNVIIFLSGMAFGIKYVYKYYLKPFLTGQKPKSDADTLLEVQKSMMEILQEIESMLEKIKKNIVETNSKNMELTRDQEEIVKISSIHEVKTELNTIKTLLINKRSFPSPPSVCPSIPEWQKGMQAQVEESQEHEDKTNACVNGDTSAADSQEPGQDTDTASPASEEPK